MQTEATKSGQAPAQPPGFERVRIIHGGTVVEHCDELFLLAAYLTGVCREKKGHKVTIRVTGDYDAGYLVEIV